MTANPSSESPPAKPIHLADSNAGAFLVTAISSTYLVDLDRRVLVRVPGRGASELAPLRAETNLVEITMCEVGSRARLVVDVLGTSEPVVTTPVLSIERVNFEELLG